MGPSRRDQFRIMDSRDQVLRRKTVRLVKVLWQHRGVEEATGVRGHDAGHLSLLV